MRKYNKQLIYEIKRKMLHLLAMIIPLSYSIFSYQKMLVILSVLTSFVVYIDIYRHSNIKIKEIVDKIFGKVMRKHQTTKNYQLSSISNLLISSLIVIAFFKTTLAITAIFILIIADSSAAIVGIKLNHSTYHTKSIEGSIVFAIITIVISLISYFFIGLNTSLSGIILATITTTLSEYYAEQIMVNDNLLIPVIYASTIFIVNLLLSVS